MTDKPDRASTRLMAFQYAITLAMQCRIEPGAVVQHAKEFEAYLTEPAHERTVPLSVVSNWRERQE